MEYRKKPVVVEAIQPSSDRSKWDDYPVWFVGSVYRNEIEQHGDIFIIPTKEGKMIASQGDYIIKGIQNEIYPCKPDIFEKTYEPVLEAIFEQDISGSIDYFPETCKNNG